MQHFYAQKIEMGTAKHLPLQKFEPIDMALRDAIAPRQAESRVNSSIISTNAEDFAAEFAHMTRFCSLEPAVQCLHLAFFEHGHKFLAKADRRYAGPRSDSPAQSVAAVR